MKKRIYMTALILSAVLMTSCFGNGKTEGEPPVNESVTDSTEKHTVPDLSGKAFDSSLQQELSNSGYLLSIKTEYSDSVPEGRIISQKPSAGTEYSEKGLTLELTVSAGKKQSTASQEASGSTDNKPGPATNSETVGDTAPSGAGLATPVWVISPTLDYDYLGTFGNTSYSIVKKWDNYGIIDINCKAYGTGAYTKLFYCPEHGLSSPDVAEPTQLSDDLIIVPDCGFATLESDRNIYVYDNSRNRVYLTGYTNGEFKIVDITDNQFFKTNSNYIAVLYNCDAELLMYDGIGMDSLSEIFGAENLEMKYGVVNNEFTTVIEFDYDEIKDGNDCYIVKKNGKYGYRGLSGQHYYECIFEEANTAYLGTAWVKYGGKWGTAAF